MFKLDAAKLASAASDVLQETQHVRVAHARTSAALGAVLPRVAGQWYKTGKLATSQFKRDLGELKGGLTKLSDAFGAASATASSSLLPLYAAALAAAGAQPAQAGLVCLDEGVSVDVDYQYAANSLEVLREGIGEARDSLARLEDSGGIAGALAELDAQVHSAKGRLDAANEAFAAFSAQVASFEGEYAARLDASPFKEKSLVVSMSDGTKDVKGAIGAFKHAASLGATVGKVAGNTWEPSKTKPFAQGLSSKLLDWTRPEKWKEAWTAATAPGAAALADEAGDAAAKAATWGEKAKAAGKLAGYVGDVLTVVGIGVGAAKAFSQAEGDTASKAAEATYEVVSSTAKVVTGKAVGAAVGSVVGGPVGTAAGFVAGCVVDFAWDAASDWVEDSGIKDDIVSGVGSVYRAAGKFITSGFDWMSNAVGLGGA